MLRTVVWDAVDYVIDTDAAGTCTNKSVPDLFFGANDHEEIDTVCVDIGKCQKEKGAVKLEFIMFIHNYAFII